MSCSKPVLSQFALWMEIKPSTVFDVGKAASTTCILHSILKIVFLLLNSATFLLRTKERGELGELTSVWDGNVSGWILNTVKWLGRKKQVYLLKWKHSVMTRELKYLDKTGMEPKGHDLVVLMKQRISHSKRCTHFCNLFFSGEFLKTVDAFDLSVRQKLNSGVKVLLARSF